MELRHYVRILRARLGLIVVITALAAGISFGVGALLPPVYKASTSLLVHSGESSSANYDDVLVSEQLAATYAELLTKRPVIEAAARELGLDPDQLEKKVYARLVPNTTIIELTVEDGDPRMAAEIANQVVTISNANARELGVRTKDLIVVEPAAIPTAPDRSALIYGVLGTLTGFVFSLGLAFLLDYQNGAIETASDIKSVLGLAHLGTIPKNSRLEPAAQLITLTHPRAPVTEAYRSIRTQVFLAKAGGLPKKLLVTSAKPATGKTALTANLGVTLAQAGSRVVIIDASVRAPALHGFFNVSNTAGLTDWLSEDVDSTDPLLKKTSVDNLQVVSSGFLPLDPSALLGSARMDELLEALAQRADWIILDSPEVLGATDAIGLARKVDGVILVVEATRTSRQSAGEACEALKEAGAIILGAVLTKTKGQRLALHRPRWLRKHRPFTALERLTKVVSRPKPGDAR
jgi:polysaccharide biosynthesis transport protein